MKSSRTYAIDSIRTNNCRRHVRLPHAVWWLVDMEHAPLFWLRCRDPVTSWHCENTTYRYPLAIVRSRLICSGSLIRLREIRLLCTEFASWWITFVLKVENYWNTNQFRGKIEKNVSEPKWQMIFSIFVHLSSLIWIWIVNSTPILNSTADILLTYIVIGSVTTRN